MTMIPPSLLPEGLSDRLPPQAEASARLARRVLDTVATHGYERVMPPLAEFEATGTWPELPKNYHPLVEFRSGDEVVTDAQVRLKGSTSWQSTLQFDGALAKVNGIQTRLPYQSDPIGRKRINEGSMQYIDMHLSHVAQFVWFGFFGKLDVAVIEVAGILPDGSLIPSTSIGNNKTWLDLADLVHVHYMKAFHVRGFLGAVKPPLRTDTPQFEWLAERLPIAPEIEVPPEPDGSAPGWRKIRRAARGQLARKQYGTPPQG